MIITTAGRTNMAMIEEAKGIAIQLQIAFIPRRKRSIHVIQQEVGDDCLVVGKQRLELYPFGEKEPCFFHPNSAMFRIKRLQNGESDPFIDATKLSSGKKFLDCTFGLGSDSITASYIVGEQGYTMGCEGNCFLAYMMKIGLQTWNDGESAILNAMKRIELKTSLALNLLQSLPDNSFDCVYFDPMFEEDISESNGIKGIKGLAVYESLSEKTIYHAHRVAKERVVLKDHYRSSRFEQFGFCVQVRKTARFHFGILEK
ncbi:class I SAM-dependent methyltransferase [Bacillus sp. V3B]|uniref:class I SAM-dependent methyltransferase n=1 Tax=Bacillus sp. V3B TaxID=2804915 RepID=UPI002109D028|nr:class I SAM-dependent methyltransferase [Bacillus sp. V3B]MCQ6273976.1 class I SAM-dependent methyltransferase [Bacillus sp. V3B]